MDHWFDPLYDASETHMVPTFRHISTIDFILLSSDLAPAAGHPRVSYVPRCDHAAISISLHLGLPVTGPGLWRFHPQLASDPTFCAELYGVLDAAAPFMPQLDCHLLWDYLKARLKRFAQDYTRKLHAQRGRQQRFLQKKRQLLLRMLAAQHAPYSDTVALNAAGSFAQVHAELSEIESQLDSIAEQQEDTLAFRAGQCWREKGERSNAYFYRCLSQRQTRQHLHALRDDQGNILTDNVSMSQDALHELFSFIPDDVCLNDSHGRLLTTPWSEDDIENCLASAPNRSSPGVDGLPYELLHVLFKHPFCRQLFTRVINNALSNSQFPPSWQRSVVILLPKKGDRTLLKNWRPISLICADAKYLYPPFSHSGWRLYSPGHHSPPNRLYGVPIHC